MRPANVWHLGLKELWSLAREPVLLALIVFAFTLAVVSASTSLPDTLHNTPIAIVDEDRSQLSSRLLDAFTPPQFLPPRRISAGEMDARMDAGLDTFALDIPPDFERDLLAGRSPTIQLNVDATRMSQAFSGSAYIQSILLQEVETFTAQRADRRPAEVRLVDRVRFNPALERSWFGSVVELINNVTMLSLVLTGAALIRERERGTIEHLLAMPVTPLEIMLSKVWSMGLVVLAATALSLLVVIRGLLAVPISGSLPLFFAGVMLNLFATSSLGIFLGTLARSMPQFGLLLMLVLLPLEMLSGGTTPRESMPPWVQIGMLAAPNTHFVLLSQGILFRGAGLGVVWPPFLALALIGLVFFAVALHRFRRAITAMGE
ncbi:MAG: membrane protein [Cyanobium sp. CACIAM 14]|nr:MAG: membrane protein [Cyanobium sp. CACIAM 14]